MGGMLGYLLIFLLAPGYGRRSYTILPQPMLAMIYLWHLIVMPAMAILALIGALIRWGARLGRTLVGARLASSSSNIEDRATQASPLQETGPSRRELLAASIVAVPPLLS